MQDIKVGDLVEIKADYYKHLTYGKHYKVVFRYYKHFSYSGELGALAVYNDAGEIMDVDNLFKLVEVAKPKSVLSGCSYFTVDNAPTHIHYKLEFGEMSKEDIVKKITQLLESV